MGNEAISSHWCIVIAALIAVAFLQYNLISVINEMYELGKKSGRSLDTSGVPFKIFWIFGVHFSIAMVPTVVTLVGLKKTSGD